MGRKIRDNELRKVPCMLIVGDREEEGGTVSMRSRAEGDLGGMGVDEASDRLVSAGALPAVG